MQNESRLRPIISVSIVSHRQAQLVANLLADIQEKCKNYSLEVLLTLNLSEDLPFRLDNFDFPVKLKQNAKPQGFAANHNAAFRDATGQYFAVLNPDIRLTNNPFSGLVTCLERYMAALAVPLVVDGNGNIEDSLRKFPTLLTIMCKAMGGCRGGDYPVGGESLFPDWAAGMFMLFREEIFRRIGGFDECYFLYYEDVDLCARLKLIDESIVACPEVTVVHLARRDSHRYFKYKRMHIVSMLRYFLRCYSLRLWLKQLR